MRINQFLAKYTDLSRRKADEAIEQGRVSVNGEQPHPGQQISNSDTVTLDNRSITPDVKTLTLILHKPAGYVVSRNGQGSKTIYDLLPQEYQLLNPVGRLDKDSSGLLLLTNDGNLANELTHPRYQKTKRYEVVLDKPLEPLHHQMISDFGIQLNDGPSRLHLSPLNDQKTSWEVVMSEGRNRQIRRTFAALGYTVAQLHRTNFGPYALENTKPGTVRVIA
jgi:23S rRNA pseudouridine2605 synthase